MNKEAIRKIAERHIHSVDKYYRMFGGLSSNLDDYSDSTIYITIHKNRNWKKDNATTAKQLALSWRNGCDALKEAKKYHVTIIHNETPTGFAIPLKELNDIAKVEALLQSVNDIPKKSALKEGSAGVVITGYFDHHDSEN